MENRERSINPDDVDEVEKVISDTERIVRERAAKLGITDQTKIDKFALDAKNSVIDLYHFGYAIEDYLGGPENKGPCDQDCIDQNIDFILDKFYSKWGSRLFDVTGEEFKLDTSKIDVYVTGLVITESSEAAKKAKENAEKAVKEAENTLNKAKELEKKAKDAQAKADQIKDKTSTEYKDAVAKAESAKKAAEAARDTAKKAKNASEEARKAYEKAEKELARLEQELKNLLGEIGGGDLGPGEEGAWDPRETISQNKDRKMEISEIKSNKNLSNVMNSMSDKQVYGLLASGVINSDLVNEYIKNGKNAPILACGTSDCEVGDLKYVFEEADREMKMSSVKDNAMLTKVMNSLTDRQAYELIASGAIPSDMVNEYIQNGANAPILPCGSAECSMIEYMNPGSTKTAGAGVDVVGLGEIQGAATDIYAATRSTNVKSAADALGEDLKEAIAEIQSSLDSGAVIRGADGQEISVKEALESMPAGGTVNADGTLTPVQPGQEEGATGCQGPCAEPDEDGDGNPG
jgi:flagellar biosynthesis GTPase FlhF